MSRLPEPLLLETIAIRDGIPERLDLHQLRVDRSRRELLKSSARLDLAKHITVPTQLTEGLVKCRVLYDDDVRSIEFRQYTPRAVEGLSIATLDDLEYSYKFADRSVFRALEQESPDRAVIIVQNGFITDATYANLVLYDGERWITPSHYLLNGIMRQWLLEHKMIEEQPVPVTDLPRYQSMKLINAMLDFDASPVIPLNDITYL